MRIVDLSAPIQPSPPDTPEALRTDIEYSGHAEGAAQIEALLGVPDRLLRDREGWATETFTNLGTHNSTHVDAPWHYNSTDRGRARGHDRRAPAGVVLRSRRGPGHDRPGRRPGGGGGGARARTGRRGARAGSGDIVLVRTGRDEFYGDPGYMALGPGVSAEATRWLFERGVRVMGIDAWGWDAPLPPGPGGHRARRAGIFWSAHQSDLGYSQIERLVNLGELPSTGFQVACFPLKIVGGRGARASGGPHLRIEGGAQPGRRPGEHRTTHTLESDVHALSGAG